MTIAEETPKARDDLQYYFCSDSVRTFFKDSVQKLQLLWTVSTYSIISKSRRYNKILNKIVNINEDCSEDISKEDQYELGQSIADSESPEYIENGEIKGSWDSEEENFLKVCRNKRRIRIFSNSDSEDERTSIPSTSQNVMGEIEIAIDGTQWIKLKAGGFRGRTPVRMIFKDIAGPTGYAKRNIMSVYVISAFELIIDRHIMEHIKDCTETEAHRVLKKRLDNHSC
ncbi:uncharacterized protein LOC122574363 [Bombus pyrosoma]|uniref:uncharacterized protein LOC122574363 n=1 Tax=Bombus pyrosoma TaxID=396416 RepID=UPI001CB94C2A|nr:uncharacterized protein LOC122574363 [Bombus pyrosoma]